MNECPRCHSACISTLQKLTLGPGHRFRCPNCGGQVGVPYGLTMIAALPAILGTCVIIFVLPSFLPTLDPDRATPADVARAVIVFIFAVALDVSALVLCLRWVPLIPR
jgi:hypothetical protein